MSTPLIGFSLILTLFLREYSLESKTVRAGETKTPRELEGGARDEDENDDPDITPANSIAHAAAPELEKEKGEVA